MTHRDIWITTEHFLLFDIERAIFLNKEDIFREVTVCLCPLVDFVILPITVGHWQAIEKATRIVLALAVHDKRWWSVNPTDTVPSFFSQPSVSKGQDRRVKYQGESQSLHWPSIETRKDIGGYFCLHSEVSNIAWTIRFDTLLFLFVKKTKCWRRESVCNECVLYAPVYSLAGTQIIKKREKLLKYYRKLKKNRWTIFSIFFLWKCMMIIIGLFPCQRNRIKKRIEFI